VVRELMSGSELKIIELPGGEPIECSPRIEGDVLRADVRPLLEALEFQVIADDLDTQNKIYIRRPTMAVTG
jgi:hypothetical protein